MKARNIACLVLALTALGSCVPATTGVGATPPAAASTIGATRLEPSRVFIETADGGERLVVELPVELGPLGPNGLLRKTRPDLHRFNPWMVTADGEPDPAHPQHYGPILIAFSEQMLEISSIEATAGDGRTRLVIGFEGGRRRVYEGEPVRVEIPAGVVFGDGPDGGLVINAAVDRSFEARTGRSPAGDADRGFSAVSRARRPLRLNWWSLPEFDPRDPPPAGSPERRLWASPHNYPIIRLWRPWGVPQTRFDEIELWADAFANDVARHVLRARVVGRELDGYAVWAHQADWMRGASGVRGQTHTGAPADALPGFRGDESPFAAQLIADARPIMLEFWRALRRELGERGLPEPDVFTWDEECVGCMSDRATGETGWLPRVDPARPGADPRGSRELVIGPWTVGDYLERRARLHGDIDYRADEPRDSPYHTRTGVSGALRAMGQAMYAWRIKKISVETFEEAFGRSIRVMNWGIVAAGEEPYDERTKLEGYLTHARPISLTAASELVYPISPIQLQSPLHNRFDELDARTPPAFYHNPWAPIDSLRRYGVEAARGAAGRPLTGADLAREFEAWYEARKARNFEQLVGLLGPEKVIPWVNVNPSDPRDLPLVAEYGPYRYGPERLRRRPHLPGDEPFRYDWNHAIVERVLRRVIGMGVREFAFWFDRGAWDKMADLAASLEAAAEAADAAR